MPDCAFSTPRRSTTTTPLQALTLMNHQFTIDMADYFALRLGQEAAKDDPRRQVARAFSIAVARRPDPAETEAAVTLIEQHGLPAFCRALFNCNEFIYLN